MEFLHFEAYFHLFAAGNFGFAGSKRFQEVIDESFLQISIKEDYIEEKVQDITAKARVISAEQLAPIQEAIEGSKIVFEKRIKEAKDKAKTEYTFVE
ncbi:MAG TPA: hypothetical protein VK498_01855, partial [Ferruginibacter sp.]|nr:hypothetical protein [Ferruginibacter sp.]